VYDVPIRLEALLDGEGGILGALDDSKLSMCRFDVIWGEFGRGGKVVRMALRAYRALR
jgi:hypothetical protein